MFDIVYNLVIVFGYFMIFSVGFLTGFMYYDYSRKKEERDLARAKKEFLEYINQYQGGERAKEQ
jgi:hypothetical protein